jgi:hypothetical protein
MANQENNSKENAKRPQQQGLKKPTSASMSNSFNPPLSERTKSPLPAINGQQNKQSDSLMSLTTANGGSTTTTSTTDEADLVLPTKVFKAKKTSVNDLSQAACSYLWFRRIKKIFLVWGKQTDPFSRFDMELARTDMIQTCEQYLDSERPKGGGIHLVCINELQHNKNILFIFILD